MIADGLKHFVGSIGVSGVVVSEILGRGDVDFDKLLHRAPNSMEHVRRYLTSYPAYHFPGYRGAARFASSISARIDRGSFRMFPATGASLSGCRGTKINSPEPPLLAISAAYPVRCGAKSADPCYLQSEKSPDKCLYSSFTIVKCSV